MDKEGRVLSAHSDFLPAVDLALGSVECIGGIKALLRAEAWCRGVRSGRRGWLRRQLPAVRADLEAKTRWTAEDLEPYRELLGQMSGATQAP